MTPDLSPPHAASGSRWLRVLGGVAAIVLVVWSSAFIWRTSFPSANGRIFCLADDAMISMAYSRNLLEGYGLDWSRRGEPVEGFTHPLWLTPMIASGLLGIPIDWRPLFVQLFSLAVLLCIPWAIARALDDPLRGLAPADLPTLRGEETSQRRILILAASVLVLTYYPTLYWSLMGMEAAAQVVILLAVCGYSLRIARGAGSRSDHLVLGSYLAMGLLLRLDMVIILGTAVAGAFMVYRRVPRLQESLTVLAIPVLAIAALLSWRYYYFHDLLPNTYYLKLTGMPLNPRLRRGAHTLYEFLGRSPVFIAMATTLGLWAAVRSLPARLLLLCCAVAWSYNVWVGGDVWEESDILRSNRFLIVGIPPLLCAMTLGLARLKTLIAERWPGRTARMFFVSCIALTCCASNGLLGSQSSAALRRILILDPPDQVEANSQIFNAVQGLSAILRPKATIATVWAGIPAYFSNYKLVDVLGYNDRHIARMESVTHFDLTNYVMYRPGHIKWDWSYVVSQYHPDLMFQAWPPGLEELPGWQKLMKSLGYRQVGDWIVWPQSRNLKGQWREAAKRSARIGN